MGNNYYYFAASLPMISFDSKASFSVEEYLDLCGQFLGEEDLASVKSILLEDIKDIKISSSVVKKHVAFEKSFKNEKANSRARRVRRNPVDYMQEDSFRDYNLEEVFSQVSKRDNLLEAEKELDKIRWQFLDDIVFGHYFDMDYLLVYGLKLKILERYKEIALSRGSEIYKELKEEASAFITEHYQRQQSL